MAESTATSTEQLRDVIHDALMSGVVTRSEIISMVTAATEPVASNGHAVNGLETYYNELPVYTELPTGLIDLPTAVDKYGRSRQVIWNWVRSGWLGERGLLRQPGSTIAHILVAEDDLVACTTKKHSKHELDELPIYDELPKGLIDLPTAGKKYGLNVRTIRGWVNKGKLEAAGRLRGPAPGGGYLVVSEDELLVHIAEPRSRGRPKKIRVVPST